eukprot:sb/3477859/
MLKSHFSTSNYHVHRVIAKVSGVVLHQLGIFSLDPNPKLSITEKEDEIEPVIDGKLLKLMLPTTLDSIGLTLTPCEDGLLVAHVEENSVGDVVGLKAGDIIFKVR